MLLKLAWRNIWRNRRRTYITLASVFFAVLLSSVLMSMKEGVYEKLIESLVVNYMGYAQVHAKDYWEEKTLDYSFEMNEVISDEIQRMPGISNSLHRVEGVALAVSSEHSRVAMVTGIDVAGEASVNRLDERVSEGSYLQPGDNAVMIGKGFAEYMELGVHDTLVLIGQGYHGAAAAGKFFIKAIVAFGSPELSKQLVIMPLPEAQKLYGMEGLINNLVLYFHDNEKSGRILKKLSSSLGNEFEVMSWDEMMPEVKNMIRTDRAEGYVFMFILYLVASFGILGTLLMMLSERTREFGVLVSVGMKRIRLATMVFMEVILISLAGALLGIIAAIPICTYFRLNPVQLGDEVKKMTEEYGLEAVIRFSTDPGVFFGQGLVVFFIACLISIYPFVVILRLNAVQALRK